MKMNYKCTGCEKLCKAQVETPVRVDNSKHLKCTVTPKIKTIWKLL